MAKPGRLRAPNRFGHRRAPGDKNETIQAEGGVRETSRPDGRPGTPSPRLGPSSSDAGASIYFRPPGWHVPRAQLWQKRKCVAAASAAAPRRAMIPPLFYITPNNGASRKPSRRGYSASQLLRPG